MGVPNQYVFIPCAYTRAGKTTLSDLWSRFRANKRISIDARRLDAFGPDYVFDATLDITGILEPAAADLTVSIRNKFNVFVDDVNLDLATRKLWIDAVRKAEPSNRMCKIYCIRIPTPISVCFERCTLNLRGLTAQYWCEVLDRMEVQLMGDPEFPVEHPNQEPMLEEGFDGIVSPSEALVLLTSNSCHPTASVDHIDFSVEIADWAELENEWKK